MKTTLQSCAFELGLFENKVLAVPRLENVQLRFTLPAATLQKGVYIISLIDSEGKLFTSKLQR